MDVVSSTHDHENNLIFSIGNGIQIPPCAARLCMCILIGLMWGGVGRVRLLVLIESTHIKFEFIKGNESLRVDNRIKSVQGFLPSCRGGPRRRTCRTIITAWTATESSECIFEFGQTATGY